MRKYLRIIIAVVFILALFCLIIGCKNKETSNPNESQTAQTVANTENIRKVIKETPATISGTLGYASMKYWIEERKGKIVEISYDMNDSEIESKLLELIDKKVSLSGTMTKYSNDSEYLVISKSSFSSSGGKKDTGFTQDQEYGAHKILFNGKIIYKNDDNSLFIKKEFSIGTDKVALIEISSGGTACPAEYVFTTVKGDGTFSSSAEFGTCSDIPKIVAKGNMITVKLPGNPPGSWTYQNGKVKKGI